SRARAGGVLELVRLALAKEVLETRPMPSLPAISLSAAAISSAWSRLSSAQGPAISASGSALPKRVAPTATTALGAGSTAMFILGGPCAGTPWGSTEPLRSAPARVERDDFCLNRHPALAFFGGA